MLHKCAVWCIGVLTLAMIGGAFAEVKSTAGLFVPFVVVCVIGWYTRYDR